ncbi:peptide ligase PGM1-related protein [Nocardia sp. CWNU-33]|uniref:preATP grasp domain-containing protein n=1 Tax=Nocardia sp. CWNU-33 TaxID=3392117 RepID=UPI00398F5307
MPKVVLANPHSRAMTARPDDLPPASWLGCYVEAARMLWSLDVADIAVLPGPVDKEFLSYLTAMLDICGEGPAVLSMQDYRSIEWNPRANPELFAAVRDRISSSGFDRSDWTMSCYVRDRDIAGWERLLGLDTDAALYAQDLAALMNSKSVFRALALAADIPVPEGYVVTAGGELLDAVVELLDRTGSVIVKQDQNSGGLGNTLITTDHEATGCGVLHTLSLGPGDDPRGDLHRKLHEHNLPHGDVLDLPAGAAPAKFVVEVYQSGTRSLSSELYIPRSGMPVLRNYGEMRMEPRWTGFVIPPQDLPATVHTEFGAGSQQIALFAQRLGYHGLINIDAMIGPDNRLSYTEFNGRAGGATNLDTIARRLLGQNYLHNHVLLTRIGVPAPRTTELRDHLEQAGIHFDTHRGSGVIIAADDPATSRIEYLVIGRGHAEAHHIETELKGLLTGLTNANA